MKMRVKVVGLVALLVSLMIAAMMLGGCAAPQQAVEPTPEEVAARLDSIVKANERQLKITRMFAYDKLKTGETIKAREYLWKEIGLDVTNQYNDWDRLYQTYMETNQADSAQIILRMGLDRFPNDTFLNATLGFMLKTQGLNEEALGCYQMAIVAEPENVDYLKKEAELFESLDMWDEAIVGYEKIVGILPDDFEMKDRLTSLLREHRDPAEYLLHLEADVVAQPENIQKRQELIFVYIEQGINDKIVVQADAIIALDVTLRDAYMRKATAQENLNLLADAIATYKALLEQHADDNVVRLKIADNYRLLDRFIDARSWVLKARQSAGGTYPEADYVLAEIYESVGDACSAGRGLKYDDKIVYTMAYGLYTKAAAGDDYNYKDKAERKLTYLEQFVPGYSDWFMNQTKEMPSADCYTWIKASWSESKYIKKFLERVAASKG
jgi:tetratricopeptide (TPR) repeat protein